MKLGQNNVLMSCLCSEFLLSYLLFSAAKHHLLRAANGKGASINYVDKQGESWVSQMSTCQEMSRAGVKNCQNLVNVVYVCPLMVVSEK